MGSWPALFWTMPGLEDEELEFIIATKSKTCSTFLVDKQPSIVFLVLKILCSDAPAADACRKNFINFEGHYATLHRVSTYLIKR
jgi:hypothetical protein